MTLSILAPWFVMVVGVTLFGVGAYVLTRAHYARSNDVDLAYLLVDGSLKPPRVTLAKATGLGAFLLSSWLLVLYAVDYKMSTEMFAVYIAAWGAVKVAGDYTALKEREMSDTAANREAREILER